MAPPSWAYQIENFDPPPDEELVCSVCQGVFCDPVQSPCHHVFCRSCLYKWLENNRNCPICRKRTTRSSVQEVIPIIKNMIMKLNMKCRNWENNCREKFTLEACEAHIKTCPCEMVQCKNKPCLKMFPRKDLRDHELKNCSHRTVKCLKCYLKILPKEQGHDCIAALKRKLKTQDEELKKKNEKIRLLKKELKKLEEIDVEEALSDSSLGSLSAADILIDLEDMASISSSDSDDYETRWFDFLEDSRTDSSIFSGELPAARRPAKRRHPAPQQPDTSDDDHGSSGLQQLSLPSPKRSWSLLGQDVSPMSQPDGAAAGPSHQYQQEHNTVRPIWRAGPQKLRTQTEVKMSSSRSRTARAGETSSTRSRSVAAPCLGPRGSPVFERTLAMLEQYNLESDDEWVPSRQREEEESDESEEEQILPEDVLDLDASSYCNSDSSDSSFEAPPRTDWFSRLLENATDIDWTSH